MANGAPDSLAILDLGTARTTLLAFRVENGVLQYSTHASAPSRGMRKGAVVSLDDAGAAIHEATSTVEARLGVPIERVFLGLTGAQVKGVSSQAGVSLTSRSREVTREDTRNVLELARSISLPEGREIIHVVPQEFVLDHQAGVHSPVGMLASRLEARIYAITVATAAKNNLVLAANRAGLEVDELIFAPLAVSEGCLRAEERQSGVGLVEMGAGTTGVLVYVQGMLAHAASIPVGSDHFTNDIAVGLKTPPAEAEHIKCAFGAVSARLVSDSSEIEVPGVGDRRSRMVPHRFLAECIEPRARELVQMIAAEVGRAGVLSSGVVLGGGGSRLAGLREMLEANLDMPVRLVNPTLISGMPDTLAEPEYGFLVGACYYAHRAWRHQQRPPTLWDRFRNRWQMLAD